MQAGTVCLTQIASREKQETTQGENDGWTTGRLEKTKTNGCSAGRGTFVVLSKIQRHSLLISAC